MEEICFSETSVDFQRTTRRYIPKDRTLHKFLLFHFPPVTRILWSWKGSFSYALFLLARTGFCIPPIRQPTHFDPEDGGDKFLRNVGYNSTHYTASYPRRWYSSSKFKLVHGHKIESLPSKFFYCLQLKIYYRLLSLSSSSSSTSLEKVFLKYRFYSHWICWT
jgi:hypothetical protein